MLTLVFFMEDKVVDLWKAILLDVGKYSIDLQCYYRIILNQKINVFLIKPQYSRGREIACNCLIVPVVVLQYIVHPKDTASWHQVHQLNGIAIHNINLNYTSYHNEYIFTIITNVKEHLIILVELLFALVIQPLQYSILCKLQIWDGLLALVNKVRSLVVIGVINDLLLD